MIISSKDLWEIVCSCIFFIILTSIHRLLTPQMYMSVLISRYNRDSRKTLLSTSVRIIYISFVSIVLWHIVGFKEQNIYIGLFLSYFLIFWPVIVQYHLLLFWKNKERIRILIGCILYTGFSILFSVIAIQCIGPMLFEQKVYEVLNNPVYGIILTFLGYLMPIGIEDILSRSAIVIEENVNSFNEKLLVLNRQLEMDSGIIKYYKYEIQKASRENNISEELLSTVIQLEMMNRGAWVIRKAEKLVCKFLPRYAAKKDYSVGLAQIKISTAQKILKESPDAFLMKMFNNAFNIELCAKILKKLSDEYWKFESDYKYVRDWTGDEYQYIAYRYLTDCTEYMNETVLLYGVMLRSKVEKKYDIENIKKELFLIDCMSDINLNENMIIQVFFDVEKVKNRCCLNNILEKQMFNSRIEGYGITEFGLMLYFKEGIEAIKMTQCLAEINIFLRRTYEIDDIRYLPVNNT
ncbi:hypothetical protein H8716_05225 [Lachnospiraceae bacterium NSJ-46]|uniref:Uncharacterized protein n=1 Tax=Jingyaoa shaoxingensis TaxID=2763671 RepID=A0ABR7N7V9_9FIRM|nr:hypothetical protein [Jingyaoa shaoxingensis]